ncbi:DUF4013 domain-containing protein [Haloplanus sp. GCM10025708]|uniref:DUF4013 domain-containing protein n=1 Tax=Haloplanus sp. GCM10025708 TaxID=3252679 RepID=UPI0036174916
MTGILVAYYVPVIAAVGVGRSLVGVRPVGGGFLLSAASRPSLVLNSFLDLLSSAPVVAAFVAAAVLSPVCAYLSTVATTRYALQDELGAAFDVSAVWETAADATTVRHWLAAAFVAFASSLVAAAASTLPVVGPFAGAFVTFYGLTAALSLWGRERRAVSVERSNAPRPAAQA